MQHAHARPARRVRRRRWLTIAASSAVLLVATPSKASAQSADSASLVEIAHSALAAQSQVMLGANATDAAAKAKLAGRHGRGAKAGLDRSARVRAAIEQHGHKFTGFADKVEVTSYRAAGDSAFLSVVYRVRFDHSSRDPKAPKTVKESYPHDLIFTRQGAEWTLASERERQLDAYQWPEDPAHKLGPTKVVPTKPGKGPSPRSRDHRTGFAPRRQPTEFAVLRSMSGLTALAHGPMVALIEAEANDGSSGSYDAYVAATYSYRWNNEDGSTGYNPAYPSFSNDCANFTSQVARAGGWQFVIGSPKDVYAYNQWWLYNESDYSHSWTVAHAFHWWLEYSGRGFWAAYTSDAMQGDMIQFDWDADGQINHAMMVSYAGPNDLLLNGHSYDLSDEPLSAILARNDPRTQYYIFAMYSSW